MSRILVIDDEPDIRALLQAILLTAGHQVILAPDGREALAHHLAQPVDLVITDIYMPGQEGIETIREFRRRSPSLPIIAMSGRPAAGTMLSIARHLGASLILQKPFPPDELLQAVHQVLSSSGSPPEAP